ncbi:hypothetical protein CQW23_30561 [Capsicum baccatum]|uniref:TF-B3 domain-containing protein n=1 Tax=Capsicum baccatum TaxID=33114 RepID=A0A2G2VA36_CAPBA|nr:hypothetical protein CQW23_30561 [Capsicum baccatum]
MFVTKLNRLLCVDGKLYYLYVIKIIFYIIQVEPLLVRIFTFSYLVHLLFHILNPGSDNPNTAWPIWDKTNFFVLLQKIPIGFLKYLKGQEHVKCGVLKRDGKKWRVKVNGRKLEEGNWGKFVEEFDLQVGNILVFSHEGNMEFEVSIFDSSQCSREYAEYMQEDVVEDEMDEEYEYEYEEEEEEEEEVATHDKPCEKSHFEYTTATNKPFIRSHFECTITQKMFSRGLLYVPQHIAIANGLTNKKCGLIVRDERQRSWNLKLSFGGTRVLTYIGYGLRKIIAENCTKEGDRINFEVVTNGKTPIWKFQVFTDGEIPMKTFQGKPSRSIKLSNETSSHAEAAANKPFAQSHFECTIREYCLSRGLLYLPLDFAKSNGLNRKCEMILKDEIERCWSVWLGRLETNFCITRGWTKFRTGNGLQVGDAYKFELIKNGKIPIAHFYCKFSFNSNVFLLRLSSML